jgi:thiosulfate reductase cytochrome b subunit
VFLSAGDLDRLSTVIRSELASANQLRFFAQAMWLLIVCALVWLLASAVTGPLFAYPWSY